MHWMRNCYARLLIDNHISDLKPEYMARFDPGEYVRMVQTAGVDSAMVYACDHNGNCYYPAAAGHMHAGLHGRDIFGAVVSGLRAAGIVPIAYYTVIYHNDAAKKYPAWRQQDANGKDHDGRYYYACPNHPEYAAFARAQLAELTAYDVSGVFVDMTFWPLVCECAQCRGKYRAETGAEIPSAINWNDPAWVRFQRARERWLAEFAAGLTAHVKALRPDWSVTHQFSPILHGWMLGQSSGIADASDYSSGDFYGGKYQHRPGAKIFAAYSQYQPYEFMTSRCVDLRDHTSSKSEEELLLHAATTLANGGAYCFIDAINPDGTLNASVYQRLGRVGARLRPFKECIQRHAPVLQAACGIYFSSHSSVNTALNGTPLNALTATRSNMDIRGNAVTDEIIGAAAALGQLHIPYRVIIDRTPDWTGLQTLIVNNAAYLSAGETARIRQFVRDGGTLLATGLTSRYDEHGRDPGDFQLADVLGITHTGRMTDTVHYLDIAGELVSCTQLAAPLVRPVTAQVLGKVAVPDFPVNDPERYASIHSNPPGMLTEYAGLTVNRHGRGTAVYLYSSLLKHRQHAQQECARTLFRQYIPPFITAAENLPSSVEVTLLRSIRANALILGLVNYPEDLPALPALNLSFRLRLPDGFYPRRVRRVATGAAHEFSAAGGLLELRLARLEHLEIFEIYAG